MVLSTMEIREVTLNTVPNVESVMGRLSSFMGGWQANYETVDPGGLVLVLWLRLDPR